MPRRPTAAFVLAVASILFGLMAFEAKRASVRLPGPEVAFFRFAVGLGLVGIAFATRLHRPRFRRYDLLFLRGLFGGLAVLCYFTTIAHLDVSIATLLNFTSPVFMALFGAIFLRERIGAQVAGALLLTLAGVALVSHAHAPPGAFGFGPWHLVGLAGAAAAGAAVTGVRGLRLVGVGPWEIVTAFCLLGLLCTAPSTLGDFRRPTVREWGFLFEVGAIAFVAQWLMNHALAGLGTATAGTITQLTPVTTLVLGALFLGERVTPAAVLGAALTLGGVFWATLLARANALALRADRPPPESPTGSSRG